ncbi:hypothetical protein [Salinicola sp. DM10]|uniref:hypothetical protein n=1 Tax=Salinicola sp. DM10 TaxID=2815721 RepID=UPI001A8CC097|nr:hypothetical protein [Salinicola sp. DM10]MCE3026886.1 hypothetical protein [Salinicola sp. DM10]
MVVLPKRRGCDFTIAQPDANVGIGIAPGTPVDLCGWVKSFLDLLGQGAVLVALVGAGCALVWGALGWYLGRQADEMSRRGTAEAGERTKVVLASN